MNIRTIVLPAAVAFFTAAANALPITDTFSAGGNLWAQPKLFTSLSWNSMDAVCPAGSAGVCGVGTLNGYDMNGWTWASSTAVASESLIS